MTLVVCRRFGVLLALAAAIRASAASATDVPVTFEQSKYSLGAVVGQDEWQPLFVFGTENVTVVDTGTIQGAQSLRISGGASTQSAGTGVLGEMGVTSAPTGISWLVRVDSLGSGKFESGLATNLAQGSTPATVIFSNDGYLQYYDVVNGAGDTYFPGDPTFSLGVVYRVELQNISIPGNTFDALVYDHNSNGLIASATGLSLQAAVPTEGVSFYVVHRGDAAGVAHVDDVNVTGFLLPGDLDLDGDVDLVDYGTFKSHWLEETPNIADFNSDGTTDLFDFVLFRGYYSDFNGGGGSELSAPVPEPSAWILAAAALPALLLRRRRRDCNSCATR